MAIQCLEGFQGINSLIKMLYASQKNALMKISSEYHLTDVKCFFSYQYLAKIILKEDPL